MKLQSSFTKILFIAIVLISGTLRSYAQVPKGFYYQSVVRDKNGNAMASKAIKLRIKITDNSGSTTLWQEDFSPTTSAQGLVNVVIGSGAKTGGTLSSFANIPWGSPSPKMEVLMDPAGGSSFITMGTNDFWSVPYAMVADSVTKMRIPKLGELPDVSKTAPSSGQVLVWDGTQWKPATLSGGGGPVALKDLSDVSGASGASKGQLLEWNGSAWVPFTLNLKSVADVNAGSATAGQILVWDGSKWNASSLNLKDMQDVSISSPSAGQALIWDGSKWKATTLPAPSIAMKDITDVNASSPSTGQYLVWDGSKWKATTPTTPSIAMKDITDVNASSPSVGQSLIWDGSKWKATTSSVAMKDITDVNASSPTLGQVLVWDGSKWKATTPVVSIGLKDLTDVKITGTPTTGYVLKYNGTTWAPAVDDTAKTVSPWLKSGKNVYYNNGFVGINSKSPANRLFLVDTVSTTRPVSAYFGITGGSTTGYTYKGLNVDIKGTNGFNRAIQGNSLGSSVSENIGLYGIGGNSSLRNYGVGGYSKAPNKSAFNGGMGAFADSNTVYNYGLVAIGSGSGASQYGVYGLANGAGDGSSTTTNTAVYGEASNNTNLNVGVYGTVTGSTGAEGHGMTALGNSSNTYNLGMFTSAGTGGTYNYGLYSAAGSTATNNYAGFFNGNVVITGTLAVTGTMSKGGGSFKIDHPQDPANKYLVHSFVESPDMMNVYNGNITTDAQGDAVVTLPTYFESLNKDFRYQLTVIGTFAQAIVAEEVSNNQFKIKTDKPGVQVSWQVTGIRHDEWAKKYPIVPEVEKTKDEKGKYLNPELYNGESVFSAPKGNIIPKANSVNELKTGGKQ